MISLILRHAARSDHSLHHHVAVIVRHGTIISIGVNTGWRHAEENAIRSVKDPQLLRGAALYSFRVGKGNRLRLAQPCQRRGDGRPSCTELIRLAGIKRVFYSGTNGDLVEWRVA